MVIREAILTGRGQKRCYPMLPYFNYYKELFISVGQLHQCILQDFLNPGWDRHHHHNGDIDDDDYDEGKPRAESGFT